MCCVDGPTCLHTCLPQLAPALVPVRPASPVPQPSRQSLPVVKHSLFHSLNATVLAQYQTQAVHHRLTTHIALMVPDAKFEAGTVARAVFNMAAKHLLLTGPSWQGIKARVALALHKDDVCIALRQDEDIKKVLESQLA